MAEIKKTSKKITELLKKLDSVTSKDVIKGIQGLKTHGNETIIEPLIKLYISTSNNVIKSEIEDLFNTMKSTKVQPNMIKFLVDENYEDAHLAILSSIWSSNLDYTDYLNEIIEAAIAGELMEAIECITIFENLEAELSEEKIMPPLITITQYMNENQLENSPKHEILVEIAQFLNHANQNI